MNGGSAENGCFIKTRPSRGSGGSASGEWINMVTNFNLTWKTACLEMLNYVRSLSFHPILFLMHATGVVHGTHTRLFHRRTPGVCSLAVLDWGNCRVSRSTVGEEAGC